MKQQIFRAARKRFDSEGLSGLSMRAIAADVGITAMAIYRHYPDKEALVNALMLDGLEAWECRVRAIADADPIQWLLAVNEAFLSFALDEPRRYEAAFLLRATSARRYPDDFAAGRSPAVALIQQRIDQAKAEGTMADIPTTEIALTMAALAQGLIALHHAGRFVGEDELRAAYRSATQRCINSFLRSRIS